MEIFNINITVKRYNFAYVAITEEENWRFTYKIDFTVILWHRY